MSGFMRTAEILAQAGLADKDLARQQLIAQRDAANAQAISSGITGSLSALTNVGLKGLDIYRQGVADVATTEAQRLQAAHKGDVGTQMNPGATTDKPYYAEGAGDVATNAVAGDAELNPQKPSGFLDSISSLLGDKEAAAAKARAIAATGIANDVAANRKLASDQAHASTNAAAENALRTQQIDESKQRMDVEKANADKTNTALDKATRDEALRNAVIQAGPGASPFSINKIVGIDVPIADIQAMQDAVARGNAAGDAKIGFEKAQANQANAAATKDYAEARVAGKGKGEPKPLAESAQVTMAKAKTTMNGLARLAGMDADFVAAHPDAGQGLANAINTRLRSVGKDDPQRSQLLGETMSQFLEWKQNVAGVRFSPELLAKEQEAFMSASDNPDTFKRLLSNMWNDSADRYNASLSIAGNSGQNVGTNAPVNYLSPNGEAIPPTRTAGDFR